MKLQFKVPLTIVGIMLVIGLATGAIMLYFQKKASMAEFQQMAEGTAAIVRSAVEHEMLEGARQQHVQDAMDRLKGRPLINEVVIFSPEGKVFASGAQEEIGSIRQDEELAKAIQSGKSVIRTESKYGRNELCVISPVFNKPECYRCHGESKKVLGVIEVGLDTSFVDAEQRRQTLIMGILGSLSFLVVGGTVTFSLRRALFKRLSRLEQAAKRLSEGDYTARAESGSSDEVGLLARTLNEMARQVEEDTHRLARWNLELQDTVALRTKELSALNQVIAAASKSLDLDTILTDSLDKVVSIMGMDAGVLRLLDERGGIVTAVAHGVPPQHTRTLFDACRVAETVGREAGSAIGAGCEVAGFSGHSCVPISSKGKEIGILCLFSRSPIRFGEEEMQLLRAMGDAIGVGVENAQVARRLRGANEQLNLLLERAMKGGFDVMFENPFLVRCWEENKCENVACPCYRSENLRCWQVAGTYCGSEATCHLAKDIGSCGECPVFKKSCQRDEITAMGEGFNNMMLLLKLEAQTKEEMRGQLLDKLISAQEEERKRIARELHDQTSQSLTSLILGLKTLETVSESTKVKQGALDLQDLTLQALDEVRRLSIELRPAALDELGLVAALRSYFRESSQRSHVNIDFRTLGLKERPHAVLETALYRIIQEAVTNVIKHADAKNIRISLEQHDGSIFTCIQDDGKGFEVGGIHTSAVWGKGLGLLGMRERAALLGGELTVESALGEGTTVRVTMPMRVAGG